MLNFNTSKSVVTSVLNKNSRILSVDRFNSNSTVHEQSIRQLDECSETVTQVTIVTSNIKYTVQGEQIRKKLEECGNPTKVTIETGNKKYTIQYEQD